MNYEEQLTPPIPQEQLTELLSLASEVCGLPGAEHDSDDSNTIRVSTASDTMMDVGQFGVLTIKSNPDYEPTAFLGIRYSVTQYGSDPGVGDTEKIYTLHRDIDGDLSMQTSDTITSDFARLLFESADFDKEVESHSDKEMVTAAQEAMRDEIFETHTSEAQDLMASIKPAKKDDYQALKELLGFALHDGIDRYEYELAVEALNVTVGRVFTDYDPRELDEESAKVRSPTSGDFILRTTQPDGSITFVHTSLWHTGVDRGSIDTRWTQGRETVTRTVASEIDGPSKEESMTPEEITRLQDSLEKAFPATEKSPSRFTRIRRWLGGSALRR